jgi:hypothetical protein
MNDIPQEVEDFANLFKCTNDRERADKLASLIGLKRMQGESDEELIERVERRIS